MAIQTSRLVVTSLAIAGMMSSAVYAQKTTPISIGYIGNDSVAHVTVNDQKIITIKSNSYNVSPLKRTQKIAKKLNEMLYDRKLRADRIMPGIKGKKFIAHVNSDVIFTVDRVIAQGENTNQSQLTLKWINNLRYALGGPPVNHQVSRGFSQRGSGSSYGYASWYGDAFHGRYTSSGEVYDMRDYTAAHRTLPLGTPVLVTNLSNGRSVVVKINDRGPFADTGHRIIDLSKSAFQAISPLGAGVMRIRMDVL